MKNVSYIFAILTVLGLGAAPAANAANGNGQSTTDYDRQMDIVNHSDEAIVSFYASNVGNSSWGPDLLGDYVLDPGDSTPLDLDDGTGYCRFDFKTVMDDGTTVIRRDVDVCTVASYTID